jgi:hypothetical protein
MDIEQINQGASRYRIEAMTLTAADVVANLGGLLFDRRGLGWDTTALLEDCIDIRPLQIIGADCADLSTTLGMPQQPRPAALAASAALYRNDCRVRARVDAAIDTRSTEVLLWGDADSIRIGSHMTAVEHHISRVAATFKAHALIAASDPKPLTEIVVEKFFATRGTWQQQYIDVFRPFTVTTSGR